MSKIFTCGVMYLAFLPLWLFMIIRYVCEIYPKLPEINKFFASVLASLILGLVISFIIVILNLRSLPMRQSFPWEIAAYKESSVATRDFLVANVLPYFGFDCTSVSGVIQIVICFLILSYLYVRHYQFPMNIFLEIWGYTFYECELKSTSGNVITANVLAHGSLKGLLGRRMDLIKMYDNDDIFYVDAKTMSK